MISVQKVSDIDIAFPAQVGHLMPKMNDIPKEFHHGHTAWNKLFSEWFFKGLASLELEEKEGINRTDALRHIKCIMGSFEPKHEHKEAAVSYLLSEWFKEPRYTSK